MNQQSDCMVFLLIQGDPKNATLDLNDDLQKNLKCCGLAHQFWIKTCIYNLHNTVNKTSLCA